MARLTSIDMSGHIDDVFQSGTGTRTSNVDGEYVDGIWRKEPQSSQLTRLTFSLLTKKISTSSRWAVSVFKTRERFMLTMVLTRLFPRMTLGHWLTLVVTRLMAFKPVSLDNRPWRNYCKFYAVRLDV